MNAKQERFVHEYLQDFNATQAAIRAGYSPKTAYSQGHRLLKDVEVEAAIKAGRERISQGSEVTAKAVLKELEALKQACLCNPPTILPDGKPLPPNIALAVKICELQGKYLGLWDGVGRPLGELYPEPTLNYKPRSKHSAS